jgi:hypothetical protein
MPTANQGIVTVLLRNAEDQRLNDIQCTISFFRHNDGGKLGRFVRFLENHREDFLMDAFPGVPRRVDVEPKRYEVVSRFFQVEPGERLLLDIPCLRNPTAGWGARFDHWKDLSAPYQSLKKALAASPELHFKVQGKKQLHPIGPFVADKYDDVDDEPLIQGKAGMLNVYAKLDATGVKGIAGKPWVQGIQKILRIQRDRVVAVINKKTANLIKSLEEQNGSEDSLYGAERGNLAGHVKNFPAPFSVSPANMHSVKTREPIGVLQLTVAFVKESDQDLFLLDADIDERGNPLLHFGDFLRHRITGKGTHPYQIYDYLHVSIDTPLLGYRLV